MKFVIACVIIVVVITLLFLMIILVFSVPYDNSEFEIRMDEKRADITKRKEALYGKNRDNSTRF